MKVPLAASVVVLVLAGALAMACAGREAPVFRSESPAGSGNWTTVAEEPAWVASPPRKAGSLFFVAEGRSNLHSIVFSPGGPMAADEATLFVRTRLLPEFPNPVFAPVLAAVPGALRLVERACREEVLTRDPVPGNTVCTGWALWELPLEPLVRLLPEGDRARARAALEQTTLAGRERGR